MGCTCDKSFGIIIIIILIIIIIIIIIICLVFIIEKILENNRKVQSVNY